MGKIGVDSNITQQTKQTPMEEALAYLTNSLDTLSDSVSKLHVRLNQIMTETPEKEGCQEEMGTSGLAGQILKKGDMVVDIKNRVDYILNCLDI